MRLRYGTSFTAGVLLIPTGRITFMERDHHETRSIVTTIVLGL